MSRQLHRLLAGGLALAGASIGAVVLTAPANAEGELAVIELNPGDEVTRTFNSVNVADPLSAFTHPEDCVDDAPTCDVIRVKLNRDLSPDAFNFLRVELNWDNGPRTPPLALLVLGLSDIGSNDMDMYVFDGDGAAVDAGAATAAPLEVAGVLATGDVYDFVVSEFSGVTSQYTMTFIFSNEIFASPFESLDPALAGGQGGGGGSGFVAPVDRSGEAAAPALVDAPAPDRLSSPLAPSGVSVLPSIATDRDFAGFRGTVDNDLAAPLFARSASSARPAPRPPGGLAVAFWLFVAPAIVLLAVVVGLRRRRSAALAA